MTPSRHIVAIRVDAVDLDAAARVISDWARHAESKYVCAANVHMAMEARDRPAFRAIVNGADLIVPDGMPLVWMLRLLGLRRATRVRGPDLMLALCREAEAARLPIGLYGSTEETLRDLAGALRERFPDLEIAYQHAPPFRPLTPEEDRAATREIRASGARILFVGLGCPKQEAWMAGHRDRLPLAQVGVGAAFDIHGGRLPACPKVLESAGLEWLFRLSQEPGRLWRRYARHNPRFVAACLRQLVADRDASE